MQFIVLAVALAAASSANAITIKFVNKCSQSEFPPCVQQFLTLINTAQTSGLLLVKLRTVCRTGRLLGVRSFSRAAPPATALRTRLS
jgi:hypothetical protein